MHLFLAALATMIFSGAVAFLLGRAGRLASVVGAAGSVIGCAMGAVAALQPLVYPATGEKSLRLAWDVPMGSFYVQLDALSAVFCLPILVICPLAAIYGAAYLQSSRHGGHLPQPSAEARPTGLGASWFYYNLLAASMLLVIVARNGVLFLVAWEIMSLASFFLVMYESRQVAVRRAGWTYLVATHMGTAFLLVLFVLLSRSSGTMDFDTFAIPPGATGLAGAAFLLAVVGFGTKAGFMPLHVWLPEAHPAAPSHVSAVMSGVMIKTGIYGILRTLTFLPHPPAWWGWTLLCVGAIGGVMGILQAIAQHDIKRLLAYSSVENIGIVAMGMGLGLLGMTYNSPLAATLGFAGAILHVINHSLFKSLLFLGAGAVLHASGTRQIDQLGGVLKKMPVTGATFLVGSVAISGLPPLNGFVSEFLIYLAAFAALLAPKLAGTAAWSISSLVAIGALSLIGGLALACFAKAFGAIFLGEPRTLRAQQAHRSPLAMRVPMILLAGACFAAAMLSPVIVRVIEPAIVTLSRNSIAMQKAMPQVLADTSHTLLYVCIGSAALLVLAVAIAIVRKRLLAGRQIDSAGTWDCGYAAPTARMQYTGSSFAEPIVKLFALFLRTRRQVDEPQGLFPAAASIDTQTPDLANTRIYRPAFLAVAWVSSKLHWLQQGRIQMYVLYIALTLLILLVLKLG